jgi:hypothetical protein
VNIVADGSSIGRGKIRAEDGKIGQLAIRRHQRAWNEMGLRVVPFADVSVGVAASALKYRRQIDLRP